MTSAVMKAGPRPLARRYAPLAGEGSECLTESLRGDGHPLLGRVGRALGRPLGAGLEPELARRVDPDLIEAIWPFDRDSPETRYRPRGIEP